MSSALSQNVTQILLDWRSGNQEALERLMPLVYDELRRLAARYMRNERSEHTLQATALVNEAYIRLVDMKVSWQDRAHFFAVAARLMRRLLVDHARGQRRAKRECGPKVSLDDALEVSSKPALDLVALDEALTRLATFDSRKAEIVELHFFGGLNNEEVAEALGISRATVQRDFIFLSIWFFLQLSGLQPLIPDSDRSWRFVSVSLKVFTGRQDMARVRTGHNGRLNFAGNGLANILRRGAGGKDRSHQQFNRYRTVSCLCFCYSRLARM